MATERSLAKDFHSLMKNIKSFSDGQATVTEWDDESLQSFQVTLAPNGGLYKDGEFLFQISVGSDFPNDPPRVYCKTAIYHPNIDTIGDPDGEICLNLFDDEVWTPQCGLQDVVQGLLFLLYNPNLEDPLCSLMTCESSENFEEKLLISLEGGIIDSYYFPPNPGYTRLHAKNRDSDRGERLGENDDTKNEGMGREEGEEGAAGGAGDAEVDGDSNKKPEFEMLYFGIKRLVTESDSENGEEANTNEEEDDLYDEDGGDSDTDSQREEDSRCEYDISHEFDDTDSDIVNDEELEELFDNIRVAESNCKNSTTGGFEMTGGFENVVSWSKMIYGATNIPMSENTLQSGILGSGEQISFPVMTGTLQGPTKDSVFLGGRTRITPKPTVMSRFFLALQTRNFRRWMV